MSELRVSTMIETPQVLFASPISGIRSTLFEPSILPLWMWNLNQMALSHSLAGKLNRAKLNPIELPNPRSETEIRFRRHFEAPTMRFADTRTLFDKIALVFRTVLITIIKIGSFLINPNLWALGFVGGIIWDATGYALDRITLVWVNMSKVMKTMVSLLMFLTLPTVVAVASFLWAADLGSQRYQQARES